MSPGGAPSPEARVLGWSRIALGTLFLVRTTPILFPLHALSLRGTLPLFEWPDDRWHGSPSLSLPSSAIAALCIARTIAALGFTMGIETLASGLIAGTTGYLVLLQRPFGFVFTIHLLYQATILLALAGAGSAVALRPTRGRAPRSGLLLMRLFVASIYTWAAISKLRLDWFDGRTLEALWHNHALYGRLADVLLATSLRRCVIAWGVALGELAVGPLLLWRSTRLAGVAGALAFHFIMEVIGHADLLGFEMAALLLCFLPGEWPIQSGSQRGASAGQEMMP